MTFEEYKKTVINSAISVGDFKKVCTDTIRSSFDNNYKISKAVDVVLLDTSYWEYCK